MTDMDEARSAPSRLADELPSWSPEQRALLAAQGLSQDVRRLRRAVAITSGRPLRDTGDGAHELARRYPPELLRRWLVDARSQRAAAERRIRVLRASPAPRPIRVVAHRRTRRPRSHRTASSSSAGSGSDGDPPGGAEIMELASTTRRVREAQAIVGIIRGRVECHPAFAMARKLTVEQARQRAYAALRAQAAAYRRCLEVGVEPRLPESPPPVRPAIIAGAPVSARETPESVSLAATYAHVMLQRQDLRERGRGRISELGMRAVMDDLVDLLGPTEAAATIEELRYRGSVRPEDDGVVMATPTPRTRHPLLRFPVGAGAEVSHG